MTENDHFQLPENPDRYNWDYRKRKAAAESDRRARENWRRQQQNKKRGRKTPVDWQGFAVPKDPPQRNPEYRTWISTMPCSQCGKKTEGGNHPHHEAEKGGRGCGIKASDNDILPLCAHCHHLRHAIGAKSFWKDRDLAVIKNNYRLLFQYRGKQQV